MIKKMVYRMLLVCSCAVLICASCKVNSMTGAVAEYDKMFIPSEDVLWTVENIEKSTKDFDSFSLEREYTISANTGLFILGGPRDCKTYVWILNGVVKSGNQILELRVKNEKTDLLTGAVVDNGSLTAGDYRLRLQCTSRAGVTKFWEARLKITP